METKILNAKSDKENLDLQEAADIIKNDGLVVFPTETVYGLGANGLSPKAIRKIFEAKNRPQDNPLILHISDQEQVLDLVKAIPPMAQDCMDMFWPGPLTLIFERSDLVPDEITAGLDTVAIRMPSNPIARKLIATAGVPIAAPSANLSGKPSPTRLSHVLMDMDGKVDLIIDGGETERGIESTVLDVSETPPMILRPGSITKEDLEVLLGEVGQDKSTIDTEAGMVPKSPGQKYKHYAPKAEAILFAGDLENVAKEVNRRIQEEHRKVAVLATTETKDLYEGADVLIDMGSREHLEEVAKNLYNSLRECDEQEVDIIFVEGFEFHDLGVGIMNRLLKACGGKVVMGL